MKLVVGHILQETRVQKYPNLYAFDVHWEEVSLLDMITREPEAELRSLQKLLFEETSVRNPSATNVRNKMGLTDVFRYGMKHLFRTADARDVKRLAAVCI
jgi:hypothetical protein